MIRQVQNSQESLFSTSVDDLLKQYKITPAIVTEWYQSGYLSYDPLAYDELDEGQEIEFHFIGSLFKSGLSLKSVETLLARLEKPNRQKTTSRKVKGQDLRKNPVKGGLRKKRAGKIE